MQRPCGPQMLARMSAAAHFDEALRISQEAGHKPGWTTGLEGLATLDTAAFAEAWAAGRALEVAAAMDGEIGRGERHRD